CRIHFLIAAPYRVAFAAAHVTQILIVAGQEGFEPPASGFGDRRSTSWSYWPARLPRRPANHSTLKNAISSRDEPYDAGIADKTSSSPGVRYFSSCSWSWSNFFPCSPYTAE